MSRYWKYGATSSRWVGPSWARICRPSMVQVVVAAPVVGDVRPRRSARVGLHLLAGQGAREILLDVREEPEAAQVESGDTTYPRCAFIRSRRWPE